MVGSDDAVQLSGYCFEVCEMLKTVIRGKNPEDLGEHVRTVLKDLERCANQLWSIFFPIYQL